MGKFGAAFWFPSFPLSKCKEHSSNMFLHILPFRARKLHHGRFAPLYFTIAGCRWLMEVPSAGICLWIASFLLHWHSFFGGSKSRGVILLCFAVLNIVSEVYSGADDQSSLSPTLPAANYQPHELCWQRSARLWYNFGFNICNSGFMFTLFSKCFSQCVHNLKLFCYVMFLSHDTFEI